MLLTSDWQLLLGQSFMNNGVPRIESQVWSPAGLAARPQHVHFVAFSFIPAGECLRSACPGLQWRP